MSAFVKSKDKFNRPYMQSLPTRFARFNSKSLNEFQFFFAHRPVIFLDTIVRHLRFNTRAVFYQLKKSFVVQYRQLIMALPNFFFG